MRALLDSTVQFTGNAKLLEQEIQSITEDLQQIQGHLLLQREFECCSSCSLFSPEQLQL
jgi:hypothetical protein